MISASEFRIRKLATVTVKKRHKPQVQWKVAVTILILTMASNPKAQDGAAKKDAPAQVPNPSPDPKAGSKDLASEVETGGLSNFRQPDHVITGVIEKVENAIKTEINALKMNDPPLGKGDKLTLVGYRLNIVNGYLYFAKIKIHGDSFVQARILQTPKGEVTLQSVTETKTDADERDYFKLPTSSSR